MRRCIYLSAFVLYLSLNLSSCSANKIIVHVETTDNLGLPLNDVSVKISDPEQCCSGEDKPCSFLTNSKGSLDFIFVTGKAFKSVEKTKKSECEIILSKIGYETLKESFLYCIYGPCSGIQNIKLKYKLLPLKNKND